MLVAFVDDGFISTFVGLLDKTHAMVTLTLPNKCGKTSDVPSLDQEAELLLGLDVHIGRKSEAFFRRRRKL